MAAATSSSSSANRAYGTSASGAAAGSEKSYFEQQREALLGEIAVSFEQVLANINKLNRSLEGVIAVGNEFSSVEALWSQFENVMAKDPEAEQQQQQQQQQQNEARENDEETSAEQNSEDTTQVDAPERTRLG